MPPKRQPSNNIPVRLTAGKITLTLKDNLGGPGKTGMVCGVDDFTIYLTRLEVIEGLGKKVRAENGYVFELPEDAFDKKNINRNSKKVLDEHVCATLLKASIDADVEIECSGLAKFSPFNLRGRANLASFHKGEGFSVTVRLKNLSKLREPVKTKLKKSRRDIKIKGGFLGKSECLLSKIQPELAECQAGGFLFDIDATCRVLAEKIFNGDIKTGLVVISGATGCGKSQLAFGLLWQYIRRIKRWKRRPHLLTIEDPIENEDYFHSIHPKFKKIIKPKSKDRDKNHQANRERGFDYTPRNLQTDAVSLKQALLDAKRMTPAAVFVGETRIDRDWHEVVEFAGSGHLVLTTTHAGSLIETIQRIFKAIDANTPAERGNTAQSLLAVIHIQGLALNTGIHACVPALWMNAGGGAANLVADGLASIVPNNPHGDCSISEAKGCLGRRWLANAIKREVEARLKEIRNNKAHRKAYESSEKHWAALLTKTLESDLVTL